MSDTTRLQLPYLAGGQAQKHVTVNESLRRLDALVQLSVKSATTSAEPASPADGDIYILPAGKTGAAWGAMADGALGYYRDGGWEELTPRHGWQAYAEDSDRLYARDASGWTALAAKEERRLIFTPGGDGVVSIYRIDTARVQNPRTAAIASIAADIITLSTSDAGLFFNTAIMGGVSYVRIWNTSKTPNQSAWVKASPAGNQLTVVDAAAIATWAAAETVQIGDPTAITPGRVIALDISPMMQTVLGRVFRQQGVLLKASVEGSGVQCSIETSEAGASGSFNGVKSDASGGNLGAQLTQTCSVQSPISNSNLVLVREKTTGSALGVTLLSVIGVWV
ncbi:DUF2793 domain-containing protein [Terricaulis sp.]|uniref:DUF2793 domain-containing protein n=1 Tax=Terricaulis sp. TaxID=2768686 RepID=UPI0037841550